jgi:hypothetical protein
MISASFSASPRRHSGDPGHLVSRRSIRGPHRIQYGILQAAQIHEFVELAMN